MLNIISEFQHAEVPVILTLVPESESIITLLKMGCSETPLGHYALLVIKKDQRLLLITRRA